jgi:hypothetical protein
VSDGTLANGGTTESSRTRNLALVGLGVAAFVATCLFIHALIPEPEITGVSSKLRFYDAHKDEFDTVFIGTSRIYHQVSPEIFDRKMAERGMPTHSFNLGVSGMHPPESFLLLERFLKLKPTKLKWVFIEFEEVQASWDQERRGTHRLLYWHNWRLTSIAIRKTINPTGEEPWSKILSRIWRGRKTVALHLKLFAQNLANVGAVSDLNDIFSASRHPDAIVHELGAGRDGYRPAGKPMAQEKIPDYTKALSKALEQTDQQLIDPYAEREYRDAAKAIRALGAIPIFLVAPALQQAPQRFRVPPDPPGEIIAFNKAQEYPQFYDPAVRFDYGHLSRAGAEQFSETLAQTFAAEVLAAKIR